jgi:hypothetical protein
VASNQVRGLFDAAVEAEFHGMDEQLLEAGYGQALGYPGRPTGGLSKVPKAGPVSY